MAKARQSNALLVRGRALPFAFFPVGGTRRAGIADVQFASSPWAVMHRAIATGASVEYREEAWSFLQQARDFYESAQGRPAANPLVYYYAFLNVGKALLRARGYSGTLDYAQHGLREERAAGAVQPEDVRVVVSDQRAGRADIYAELVANLGYTRPAPGDSHSASQLVSEVVVGHRLWRDATRNSERFIAVEHLEFRQYKPRKELWLRLYLDRESVERRGLSHKGLLQKSGLSTSFDVVTAPDIARDVICLEQSTAVKYKGRPTDDVMPVVESVRPDLWRIATSVPDYRRYYVHLSDTGTSLPQVASLWCLLFYLGSIVRYRPHLFESLTAGKYGPFIDEFLTSQPSQLLYLLASEMGRREIVRPAII